MPASFDGMLKLLGGARPARYRDARQMQGAVIASCPYCLRSGPQQDQPVFILF